MITILEQPDLLSTSKNPMIFKVKTDMLYDSVSLPKERVITFASAPTSGDDFILFSFVNPVTGIEKRIKMLYLSMISDYPQGEVYDNIRFIFPAIGNGTNAARLCSALWAHDDFRSFFTFSVDSDSVSIKAAEDYPDLELEVFISSSFSTFEKFEHVDKSERLGYYMNAELFFQQVKIEDFNDSNINQTGFKHLGTFALVLDENGETFIDVAPFLDDEMETNEAVTRLPFDNTILTTGGDTAVKFHIANVLNRFYIKFSEGFNETEIYSEQKTPIQEVLMGGMSDEDFAVNSLFTQLMQDNISGKVLHLNMLKSPVKLSQNQTQFTHILFRKEFEFALRINVIDISGAHDVRVLECDYSNDIDQFFIASIPCGYEDLNLENLKSVGDTVVSWELVFTISTGFGPTYRQVRKFHFDEVCERKVIMFRNAFGLFETIAVNGDWTESLKVNKLVGVRNYLESKRNKRLSSSFVFSSSSTNSYTATTHVMPNDELKRWQMFLTAREAYIHEDSVWVDAIVDTSDAEIRTINKYIGQLEVNIFKSNDSNRLSFFANKPTVESFEITGKFLAKIATGVVNTNGIRNIVVTSKMCRDVEGTTYTISTTDVDNGKFTFEVIGIEKDGEYLVSLVMIDTETEKEYVTNHRFKLSLNRAVIETSATTVLFQVKASATEDINATVYWGNTTEIDVEVISADSTETFSKNFGFSGKKVIIFTTDFDEVRNFSSNTNFKIDYSIFPNLQEINHSTSDGNKYLSGLTKLKKIMFSNANIQKINVGFQQRLEELTLTNLNFNSFTFVELIYELWKNRKAMKTIPVIIITNIGVATPQEVTDMCAGTGNYAGQGLVADYGWTVTIS